MSDISFLLVHGSWHGPWAWNLVRPLLEARGHVTAAISLPSIGTDPAALGDMLADGKAISEAAAALPGDVVVVGHSYGGAAVSSASFGQNVKRLIFLAAFMPDTGRTYVSYLPPGPLPPYVELRDDGTFAVPSGQARPAFYHDCPETLAAWAESLLRPQSQAVFAQEVPDASWRHVPSAYITATEDHALPPDFQRQFFGQADVVRNIPGSHSPMLARPIELTDMLVELAEG